jgi:hypothetical protein
MQALALPFHHLLTHPSEPILIPFTMPPYYRWATRYTIEVLVIN